MKYLLFIQLSLFGIFVWGQENNRDLIENSVQIIEADSTLKTNVYDYKELTGLNDGIGTIKVWWKENQIFKIHEKFVVPDGMIRTIVYLKNKIPIKIIDIEQKYESNNNKSKDKELKEVYRENIYVLDWNNDIFKIQQIGNRSLTEETCSIQDIALATIERAEKAIRQ